MRGIAAYQARLPRLRVGEQIAADITRWQSVGAQAGNHDVGKVLADALALCQRLQRRGVDLRALALVGEVVVDALHQVTRCRHQRHTRRKAWPGVSGEFRVARGVGRRKNELRSSVKRFIGAVTKALTHLLPRPSAVWLVSDLGGHQAARNHFQLGVCGLQRKENACVAVHVHRGNLLCGCWGDIQAVADQLLADSVERLQVGNMLCNVHRWHVVVAGFVRDAQLHGDWRSGAQALSGLAGVGEIGGPDFFRHMKGRFAAIEQQLNERGVAVTIGIKGAKVYQQPMSRIWHAV